MRKALPPGRGTCWFLWGALSLGLLLMGLAGCTPSGPTPVANVTSQPGYSDSGWSEEPLEPPAAETTEPASQPAESEPQQQTAQTETPAAGQLSGQTEQQPSSPGGEELAMGGTTKPSYPPGVKLVPIPLVLPPPAFKGTPVPLKEPHVEKPRGAPREPFLAPEGTYNVAFGMPATCSDPMPVSGEVDYVTDGAKEASDFGYLELHPGLQWVQIDLGRRTTIYAIVVWHNHAEARVYRDVIVQVSDDPDFLSAQTVFNNDYDNSAGLGIGQDLGYVETSEGKLIDCGGVEGRYVRLYSNGNHIDPKNHYAEVEVFGRPAE